MHLTKRSAGCRQFSLGGTAGSPTAKMVPWGDRAGEGMRMNAGTGADFKKRPPDQTEVE
jgi:hypothetical protein